MKPAARWRIIGQALADAGDDLRAFAATGHEATPTVARGEALERALARQGLVIVERPTPLAPLTEVGPVLDEPELADALEWINDERFDACLIIEPDVECPLYDHGADDIAVSISLEDGGKTLASAIFEAARQRRSEALDKALA